MVDQSSSKRNARRPNAASARTSVGDRADGCVSAKGIGCANAGIRKSLEKQRCVLCHNDNRKSPLEEAGTKTLLERIKNLETDKTGLNTLVTEQQGNYNQLLIKYAGAENFIDLLRIRSEACNCSITWADALEGHGPSARIKNVDFGMDASPARSEESLFRGLLESDSDKEHENTIGAIFSDGELNGNDFVNLENNKTGPDFRTDSGFNGSENSFVSVDALSKLMQHSNVRDRNANDGDVDYDKSSFESLAVTTQLNPNYLPVHQLSDTSNCDKLDSPVKSQPREDDHLGLKGYEIQEDGVDSKNKLSSQHACLSSEESSPLQDISGNSKRTSTARRKGMAKSKPANENGNQRRHSTLQDRPRVHWYVFALHFMN